METVTIQQAFENALAHHRSGRLAEAGALYRQILAAEPRHADSLHLLGVIAHQDGRNAEAADLIHRAIGLAPAVAVFHSNLGMALAAQGRFGEAADAHREAITLDPNFADAHYNLAITLKDMGRLDEAVAAYRRTIQLRPDDAVAHSNLGETLRELGRADEASAECRRAIELDPNLPEAHNNLGSALMDQGRIEEAEGAFCRALALRPDLPEAHNNLGNALQARRDLAGAIASYRRALAIRPDYELACNNLGVTLNTQGRPDEAVTMLRRAIDLNPGYVEAHDNLGNVFKDTGRLDDAVAAFRRALELRPGYTGAHSNLINTLHFHPDHDAASIHEEHRRWNRQFAEPLRQFLRPHSNDRNPDRRLRIGYVSPDFYAQAESFFVVPLFEAHDRERYEIHAYASVALPDPVTTRLRRSVSTWHDVLALDNGALAEKIGEDGIDILVDLTMHMGGNRLPLFARKPAPVQVTWLAYPGSTGLETMDYRITDAFIDPPPMGTAGYSEESVRLPDSWCCYDPMSDLAKTPVQTPQWGDFIRFGSLNNFCKFNEPLLRVWAQLLTAVPASRLLLLAPEGTHRDALRRTFHTMGIDGARVEFAGKCSRNEYLRLYDRIDIALDPLPYNGITTTLDALWMGVPVVSLAGKTAAGRAGLSLLSTAGLPELAAQAPEEFVRIASDLARDLPRLAGLRSTLRQRLQASPLMDAPRFARNIEGACRDMWRKWCAATMGRE